MREDVTGRRVGRIVEVEAYIGTDDRASHARFGRTPRNGVMFGPPGIAYVYLVYGMHHCLNVVTEPIGRPAAILIRAVAAIEGLEAMRAARADAARGLDAAGRIGAVADHRLASGPGLVAAAFSIDRTATGLDLLDPDGPLRLAAPPANEPTPPIVATPRIGVAYAGSPWSERPWRFVAAGDASISRSPA